MPTYEYECTVCGLRLAHRQAMTDDPVRQCPDCTGELKRLITGGTGFVTKGGQGALVREMGPCRLEREGKTCCGRGERCNEPRCRE